MITTGRAGRLLLMCATTLALTGCAAMRRYEARDTGDLLVEAGFTPKPADTPDRAETLHEMPPLEMVGQPENGRVIYRYADPYGCDCLYVGDQQAYAQYQSLARRKIATERHQTVEAEEKAAMDRSFWGPWW